jgi:hypothetical protein
MNSAILERILGKLTQSRNRASFTPATHDHPRSHCAVAFWKQRSPCTHSTPSLNGVAWALLRGEAGGEAAAVRNSWRPCNNNRVLPKHLIQRCWRHVERRGVPLSLLSLLDFACEASSPSAPLLARRERRSEIKDFLSLRGGEDPF